MSCLHVSQFQWQNLDWNVKSKKKKFNLNIFLRDPCIFSVRVEPTVKETWNSTAICTYQVEYSKRCPSASVLSCCLSRHLMSSCDLNIPLMYLIGCSDNPHSILWSILALLHLFLPQVQSATAMRLLLSFIDKLFLRTEVNVWHSLVMVRVFE